MASETPAPMFTIGWDTEVGMTVEGYDSDGDPIGECPILLRDQVREHVGNVLLAELRKDITRQIREDVTAVIHSEIEGLVREVLRGEIKRTNSWGEPMGKPSTMRELIAEDVKAYINEPTNRSYHDNRKSGFRELLRTEVENALAKDLKDTIAEVRKQVSETVRQSAANMFASAAERAAL